MPRALWNGSLSFGLVNVPVSLLSATRSRDIRMREIDADREEPVSVRRVCSAENVQVPYEQVARGLEVDGEMVMLSEQELASAQPRRTDTIEIERFVELSQIDPVMYDRSYWLAPTNEAQGPLRAYRLLVEAMAAGGRAATGETVIHNREHPVLVRAHEDRLLLSTLLFAHEIRDTAELEIPEIEPDELALQRTIAVIEELEHRLRALPLPRPPPSAPAGADRRQARGQADRGGAAGTARAGAHAGPDRRARREPCADQGQAPAERQGESRCPQDPRRNTQASLGRQAERVSREPAGPDALTTACNWASLGVDGRRSG